MTPTEKLCHEVLEAGARATLKPWTAHHNLGNYYDLYGFEQRSGNEENIGIIGEGIPKNDIDFITLTRTAAPKLAEECLRLLLVEKRVIGEVAVVVAEKLEADDKATYYQKFSKLQKRLAEAEEKLKFYADPKNFTIHSKMIGQGLPGNMRKTSEEIRITWPWMEARAHLDKYKEQHEEKKPT